MGFSGNQEQKGASLTLERLLVPSWQQNTLSRELWASLFNSGEQPGRQVHAQSIQLWTSLLLFAVFQLQEGTEVSADSAGVRGARSCWLISPETQVSSAKRGAFVRDLMGRSVLSRAGSPWGLGVSRRLSCHQLRWHLLSSCRMNEWVTWFCSSVFGGEQRMGVGSSRERPHAPGPPSGCGGGRKAKGSRDVGGDPVRGMEPCKGKWLEASLEMLAGVSAAPCSTQEDL